MRVHSRPWDAVKFKDSLASAPEYKQLELYHFHSRRNSKRLKTAGTPVRCIITSAWEHSLERLEASGS